MSRQCDINLLIRSFLNIGFRNFAIHFPPFLTIMKRTDMFLAKGLHVKCREMKIPYLRSNINRFPVDDAHVPWDVNFDGYSPPDYTANSVKKKPWADSDVYQNCKFNSIEEGINRISYHGEYALDAGGRPLNPFGRTGLRGRGLLGRWGPNHAADAIVSRMFNGQLQFVAIERNDTGELAIPGGMIDKWESWEKAVVREFHEEALGEKKIPGSENFWQMAKIVYQGYVDDHRNTDNAWIETTCVNFHDTTCLFDNIHLKGGDDAKSARWINASSNLNLYASHYYLINLFAKIHGINLEV